MYAASRRGQSSLMIMDGDTTTLSFLFEKESFQVSETQRLSRKMAQGFGAIRTYMRSLESGEGVTAIEPQSARMTSVDGYTEIFIVESAFDGRLDEILSVERTVGREGDFGIVLCSGIAPELSGAVPSADAAAGSMVYDPQTGGIIVLYKEHSFAEPVYLLAKLDHENSSAYKLLAQTEGERRLYFN